MSRASQTFAGNSRSFFLPMNFTSASFLDEIQIQPQSQPQSIMGVSDPLRMFNQCEYLLEINAFFISMFVALLLGASGRINVVLF